MISRQRMVAIFCAAVSVCVSAGSLLSAAQADDAATRVDFASDVAPLLVKKCLGCHAGNDPAGGLNLTGRDSVLSGGESGAAIVAGKPDESPLLDRVRRGEMPPPEKGEHLTEAEVSRLASWIADGANWPADRGLSPYEYSTEKRAGLDWWSLQAPVWPDVPAQAIDWGRNAIDAFIARGLVTAGLGPTPEADRRTLLRRAKFDLLGLPPTPEEVDEFLADAAPDAYERLIDRLLTSPHYGERWGRHWLDVVRFGETDGYETNKPRRTAWPYRDYVIDALNDDKPFAQFILEQLAGDQLGADAATGFLVGGTHDVVGIQNIEGQLQQRANDLDDILSTTATTFLGMTAGCARCHDHKFDPITQRDYYALQAVFAGVRHGERDLKPPDYEQRQREEPDVRRELATIERRLADFEPLAIVADGAAAQRAPVHTSANVDRFVPAPAKFVRFSVQATTGAEPCIDELEIYTAEATPRNVALASAGAKVTASGVYSDGASPLHRLEHVNDGQYGNARSWISSENGAGWVMVELAEPVEIARVAWARDREGKFADRLATKYRIELALRPEQWQTVATSDDRRPYVADAKPPSLSPETVPAAQAEEFKTLLADRDRWLAHLPNAGTRKIYAGTFEQPKSTHRLHRGDPMQPREEVSPGAIVALGNPLSLAADTPEHERRLALGRWLADPRNPLVARVLVNRLWHYHFGQGLVSTPSNFGFHGGHPSHPELLDWLASEFLARGGSLKAMHRLILCSATYRQASTTSATASTIDADTRMLWRYRPRRLEAEPIRDAILAVSGNLDLRRGGLGYDPFEPDDSYVHIYVPRQSFGPAEWRRMVYQLKPRVLQDATFGVFDCPDASQVSAKRNISTTAMQALNLLNSPFMVQQSREFAARVRREAGDDATAQARRAFRLALAREPDADEFARGTALVRDHGLEALCRGIYNASEFIFVD
jgi:mono/diheme cytochrome c family protein